jgi:hypothetical protein
MHGTYGGQGGIGLEFYPESAIVDCGEAARAYPYEIQANGTQTTVKIKDPQHPVLFVLKPDGTPAAGAGPYEVHRPTITGQNDNGDFTFAPLNATSNLGALVPGATPSAAGVTTEASESAKRARAVDATLATTSTGNAV